MAKKIDWIGRYDKWKWKNQWGSGLFKNQINHFGIKEIKITKFLYSTWKGHLRN